jgi:outer membrane protein assembly factor BamB
VPAFAGPALFPVRTAWTIPLGHRLTGPPAFSSGRGFFPVDSTHFSAYDLTTGELVWTVEAKSTNVPVAGGGFVFVVDGEALTALDERDGARAWRMPFGDPLAAPLIWDNGWLIAATQSGSVLALRATDGQVIWRREVGAPLSAPAALAADRVYLPVADRRIIAVAVETGEPVWEQTVGGVPNEILATDDRVYFGSDDNRFYCLLASSGRVDWAWTAGADVIGLPALDDDRVYFVALDNVLRALDRRSGNQRWKRALPLRPASGPVRAADTIVVRGVGATVRAFFAANGEPAGELQTPGDIIAPPHVTYQLGLPLLVSVTRTLDKGAMVTAVTRAIEPPLAPLAPLPNPIMPALPR